MPKEILAETVEVRPGRKLYCRHVILGATVGKEQEAVPTPVPSSSPQQAVSTRHLICIHGTAASQETYQPLMVALDRMVQQQQQQGNIGPQKARVHCWLYDAVGCGQSAKVTAQRDYGDDEQVKDLHAFLTQLVLPEMKKDLSISSSPPELYMMGHSYGPTWIFKWMSHLEGLQTQEQDNGDPAMVDSSLLKPTGLILLCTGVESKDLVHQGPFLFRYDYVPPLWILNWIQPTLTKMFLKGGFAEETWRNQPELITQAQRANNQNDMQVVRYYYRSHDWLSDLSGFTSKGYRFLVVHGSQDEIIPIRNGQAVANQLGTSLVTIDNASHMVLLEQPETAASHVLRFMSSGDGVAMEATINRTA